MLQGAGWPHGLKNGLVTNKSNAENAHCAVDSTKSPPISDRRMWFNVALWTKPNPAQTFYGQNRGKPPRCLGKNLGIMALSMR